MNNFTTAAKLGERSRCFARHFWQCTFSHQDFQGKESDQAETQSAAFYVFHDKYQSYKHEKIGGWVGEGVN